MGMSFDMLKIDIGDQIKGFKTKPCLAIIVFLLSHFYFTGLQRRMSITTGGKLGNGVSAL
jgi:hypothetical protein